jgi:hypothetical protein
VSSKDKHAHPTSSWKLTGSWAGAWKVFATIGFLGLLGAGAGYTMDPRRFAFSWMFAYVTSLTIALGAMFFVLVQRLTSAGWSVTVRRTAEFFSYGIIALIPLFIPVLMSMGHLFPWLAPAADHGKAETPAAVHGSISLITPAYAQEHAAPTATPHPLPAPPSGHEGQPPAAEGSAGLDPHAGLGAGHDGVSAREHAQHEAHALVRAEILEHKSAYLNKSFFYIRACLYFLIWTILAVRLFGYSAAQDISKDPQLTVRAQQFAPPATFLFALTLTFAAFDWVMSLEPTWFSTIFGVYFFAAGVVSSYAVLILVTMALRSSGPLEGAVTVEHYHDLGKLMFGFLVFWAYIGFSQFMLIWYAALPEETTWYHNRWDHDPWAKVSMALLLGHFVFPFFWTISRNFKRNLGRLQIGAGIILVMHVVDMYWFVMPNYLIGKDGFSFSWIDLACLCAVGGTYGAFVFYRMTKFSLVPVGDPRLERSLHFQNA